MFDRFLNSSDSAEQTTDDQAQSDSLTPGNDSSVSDPSVAPQSRLGETYDITEQDTTYVGGKPAIADTADEGLVAGSYIREMLESGANTSSAPIWIGYNDALMQSCGKTI